MMFVSLDDVELSDVTCSVDELVDNVYMMSLDRSANVRRGATRVSWTIAGRMPWSQQASTIVMRLSDMIGAKVRFVAAEAREQGLPREYADVIVRSVATTLPDLDDMVDWSCRFDLAGPVRRTLSTCLPSCVAHV